MWKTKQPFAKENSLGGEIDAPHQKNKKGRRNPALLFKGGIDFTGLRCRRGSMNLPIRLRKEREEIAVRSLRGVVHAEEKCIKTPAALDPGKKKEREGGYLSRLGKGA